MADNFPKSNKGKQLSLEAYNKIKEKKAQNRLKMNLPPLIKAIMIIPVVLLLGTLILYLFNLRLLAEH